MPESLQLPIRDKIISSLITDPVAILTFDGRVYDYVPDQKIYPYVRYGVDITTNGDATGGVVGGVTRVTLHVFDNGVGRENVALAMKLVNTVVKGLDGSSLSEGYLVSLEWQSEQILGDGGQRAWHGVIEYDAWAAVDA